MRGRWPPTGKGATRERDPAEEDLHQSAVLAYVERNRPAVIDEQQLSALRLSVAKSVGPGRGISRQYLLDVLVQTDVPVVRSLGGLPVDLRGRVHVRDPEAAASSLLDLQQEFEQARGRGDRQRAEDCRSAVRQAKDRLRLVLRRPRLSPQKKEVKQELLRWFLIWLETPELFSQWLELRRGAKTQR